MVGLRSDDQSSSYSKRPASIPRFLRRRPAGVICSLLMFNLLTLASSALSICQVVVPTMHARTMIVLYLSLSLSLSLLVVVIDYKLVITSRFRFSTYAISTYIIKRKEKKTGTYDDQHADCPSTHVPRIYRSMA